VDGIAKKYFAARVTLGNRASWALHKESYPSSPPLMRCFLYAPNSALTAAESMVPLITGGATADGKETPPLSLLRGNSQTLEANCNYGCLAARYQGAAGSSLLLGSPQLSMCSFSGRTVIQIVNRHRARIRFRCRSFITAEGRRRYESVEEDGSQPQSKPAAVLLVSPPRRRLHRRRWYKR
jgi:hypothetical protein